MSRVIRFGDFELDVDGYQLTRAGARIKLEKLPMDLLVLLATRAGTLVSREEIHASVWGTGVFVERDAAINTAIRKLRQALNDTPGKPTFIETIVGKGYRFAAPSRPPAQSGSHFAAQSGYVLKHGDRQFDLREGENLLGRDPQAQVYLDHPSVSRRHARILIQHGTARLEDLASRNGTFVDGCRLTGSLDLHRGAILSLGPLTLTFLIRSAPASTQPASGALKAAKL
jgi:DNA-binding winged helix-turn-helix (wHTH) protein